MLQKDDYFQFAIGTLMLNGIDVYVKCGSRHLVIDEDGLSKVYVKAATMDNVSVKLTITEKERNEIFSPMLGYRYLCVADVLGQRLWLIDVKDLDSGSVCIRLNSRFDEYLIRYKRERRIAQVAIAKNISKKEVFEMIKPKNVDAVKNEVLELLDERNENGTEKEN